MSLIVYKSALLQIMAWRKTGDKPLSEPMMVEFPDAYMRHSMSKLTKMSHPWAWWCLIVGVHPQWWDVESACVQCWLSIVMTTRQWMQGPDNNVNLAIKLIILKEDSLRLRMFQKKQISNDPWKIATQSFLLWIGLTMRSSKTAVEMRVSVICVGTWRRW